MAPDEEEKSLLSLDCDLITPLQVTPASFEITNRNIYVMIQVEVRALWRMRTFINIYFLNICFLRHRKKARRKRMRRVLSFSRNRKTKKLHYPLLRHEIQQFINIFCSCVSPILALIFVGLSLQFFVQDIYTRRYLLRPSALELFTTEGDTVLINFPKRSMRNRVWRRIISMRPVCLADYHQVAKSTMERESRKVTA